MALKRNLSIAAALALLAAVVVLGLLQLFQLRFRSGDIFPAYSTFRTDPKGAKIFYRALEEYPGISVQRLLKPLDKGERGAGKTVLFLGCNYYMGIHDFDDVLDPFLSSGGHAVIAYEASQATYSDYDWECASCTNSADDVENTTEPEPTEEEAVDEKEHDPETCPGCKARKIRERWSVKYDRFTRDELAAMDPETAATGEQPGLDPVPWQSALYFKDLGEAWNVLYTFCGEPVVIEREWEKGSVILMADSYLFSNEAMVTDRHTETVIRMLGSPTSVLFDELHLGVQSQESIMMLVKRYRLTGVLFALVILAGLFVWQRSSSFIPKYTDPNADGNDVGMSVDSMHGFTNLLIRHVPPKDLLDTMMHEWKAVFARQATMKKKDEKLTEEFRKQDAMGGKQHPVDTYNRLVKSLKERK